MKNLNKCYTCGYNKENLIHIEPITGHPFTFKNDSTAMSYLLESEIGKEIEGFKSICQEMINLKSRKAAVYSNTWRVFGINGTFAEIGRKFSRIWINRYKEPKDIDFETLRDSLIDLAVYSIMTIQLLDDKDTEDKIFNILTK